MENHEGESKAEKILSFLGIPDFLIKQYYHHPQQEKNSRQLQDVRGEPSSSFNGRTDFTQAEIREAAMSLVNSIRTDFTRTLLTIGQPRHEADSITTGEVYGHYNLLMPDTTNQELKVLKTSKIPLTRPEDVFLTRETPKKKLWIPAALLQFFTLTSYKYAENNIQSFGLLSGELINGEYYVSVLIIPIQGSTLYSAKEEISSFERRKNLTRLGWIYLKPSDNFCSLSPSEMHSLYHLQEECPESFSVVIAPKDKERQYGIYRLTELGMLVSEACKQQEQNHEHGERSPDGHLMYYNCYHVQLVRIDMFEIRLFGSTMKNQREESIAERLLRFVGVSDYVIEKYYQNHRQQQQQKQQDVKGESEKPRVVEQSSSSRSSREGESFSDRAHVALLKVREAATILVNSIRAEFSRTQLIDNKAKFSVDESTYVNIYSFYNLLMPDTNQELQVLKSKKLPRLQMNDVFATLERFQKKVFVPASMLQFFMLTSYDNTKNNIQSCGVFSGTLVREMYVVSVVFIILKDAHATFDSTEERISSFERTNGLTRLGRICLKPSNDFCSLSPSEMHSQYPLQEKLPEFFSVVIAPKDKEGQYGIYRLTDAGMSVIGECKQQENHEHGERSLDGHLMYYNCQHVHLMPMDEEFQIKFTV